MSDPAAIVLFTLGENRFLLNIMVAVVILGYRVSSCVVVGPR